MNEPRWSGRRKRPITEAVDLTEPETKSIWKKKRKRVMNKTLKGAGTETHRFYPKLRLTKRRRSNIDLFWDPTPDTLPESLGERHEHKSKLPKPDTESANRAMSLIPDKFHDVALVTTSTCQEETDEQSSDFPL